jgi:hypothetical protein
MHKVAGLLTPSKPLMMRFIIAALDEATLSRRNPQFRISIPGWAGRPSRCFHGVKCQRRRIRHHHPAFPADSCI